MLFKKNYGRIEENATAEAVAADEARNAANIDYIAMMADVEIPTEEEENNVSED